MSKSEKPDYPPFESTTGAPIHIALLTGHTASVGLKPTPLHPRFHREAVLRGAVPAGFKSAGVDAGGAVNVEKTRDEVILAAISKMVDEATDDPTRSGELFTGDGRPDATVLSTRCGFPVRAGERDAAWDKYQATAEDGEND